MNSTYKITKLKNERNKQFSKKTSIRFFFFSYNLIRNIYFRILHNKYRRLLPKYKSSENTNE